MAYNKIRHSPEEKAILRTLVYSDLFDFPLTEQELWFFLQNKRPISRTVFLRALQSLVHSGQVKRVFSGKVAYIALAEREPIIHKRRKQLSEVAHKMRIATRAAKLLSYIPSIKLLGISGGLAIRDVDKNDDIDFFIIAKKGTLFTTRFWVLCLLEYLNLRRRRGDRSPANKVCVNLYLDERSLIWNPFERDLFIAREIVQLQPLFDRSGMYAHFLEANRWVAQYYPNAFIERSSLSLTNWQRMSYLLHSFSSIFIFLGGERVLQLLQYLLMKRAQGEIPRDSHILRFHPNDYRANVVSELRRKYRELGLLTRS